MKDFLEREIKVGDHVVWPTRYSSTMYMSYGIVEGFDVKGVSWGVPVPRVLVRVEKEGRRIFKKGRIAKLEAIDRVTILERPDQSLLPEASSEA